jgi:transcriptional regulator with PAS, ATPase and Fis domain
MVFLDEIGEMSPSLQPKLLRVLQEKEFTRVGGDFVLKTDARILAATNRNLINMMQSGKFREDLFFRLNVVPIVVPPLRERREDILPLLANLFEKNTTQHDRVIRGMSPRFRQMLLRYDYPGNVRELENIIQRAVILADSPLLDVGNLPADLVCGLKISLNPVPDSYVQVKTESLLEALQKIAIITEKGEKKLWHKGLRCITIDDIHRFLIIQGNKWFSRSCFEEFLRTCSRSDLGKYKTAGVYLRILKSGNILAHNGRKANPSAYCLANRFVKSIQCS